eukprot:5822209-Amphidinium_carterae.1
MAWGGKARELRVLPKFDFSGTCKISSVFPNRSVKTLLWHISSILVKGKSAGSPISSHVSSLLLLAVAGQCWCCKANRPGGRHIMLARGYSKWIHLPLRTAWRKLGNAACYLDAC